MISAFRARDQLLIGQAIINNDGTFDLNIDFSELQIGEEFYITGYAYQHYFTSKYEMKRHIYISERHCIKVQEYTVPPSPAPTQTPIHFLPPPILQQEDDNFASIKVFLELVYIIQIMVKTQV